MKIRLVEFNDSGHRCWKIESLPTRVEVYIPECSWHKYWTNYFSPGDPVYLSYELAKKDYDDIINGKLDGGKRVLEENEV